MREFFARRRPSPAMALAFVALLAALSGTAVALPGRNTVDSGDLKRGAVKRHDIGRNAVNGSKVRNRSLTGADARNNSFTGADVRALTGADVNSDSLTGTDLNESTLGKVPSAAAADTAASAGSAGSVAGRTPFLAKLSAGQSQTLATNGAVSIVAECLTDAGNDIIRILGATSQDGAAQGGSNSYTGAAGSTLDTTTPAASRVILSNSAADGTTEVEWNIDAGWVMAPDGKSVSVDGETTALGVNYAGAECVASGVVNAAG